MTAVITELQHARINREITTALGVSPQPFIDPMYDDVPFSGNMWPISKHTSLQIDQDAHLGLVRHPGMRLPSYSGETITMDAVVFSAKEIRTQETRKGGKVIITVGRPLLETGGAVVIYSNGRVVFQLTEQPSPVRNWFEPSTEAQRSPDEEGV